MFATAADSPILPFSALLKVPVSGRAASAQDPQERRKQVRMSQPRSPAGLDSCRRIGLVADSHSDLAALRHACSALGERGAERVVHLGDICDSLQAGVLEACIGFLKEREILSVKGNNDFLLESLLRQQPPAERARSERLAAFLRDLPFTMVSGDVCFAHSLPFDSLRAFYEPIDIGSPDRAREVFRSTPHRILFCGHSHSPVAFRWNRGLVKREPVPMEEPLRLDPAERYIFVIGSVAEGECALYDRGADRFQRIRLFP